MAHGYYFVLSIGAVLAACAVYSFSGHFAFIHRTYAAAKSWVLHVWPQAFPESSAAYLTHVAELEAKRNARAPSFAQVAAFSGRQLARVPTRRHGNFGGIVSLGAALG